MPDWSYRTVLGPAYRRLPPRGRDRVRCAVGRLAASRAGGRVVAALADGEAPPGLRRPLLGPVPHGPVGAGAELAGGPSMLPLAVRVGAAFVEVRVPDAPPGEWDGRAWTGRLSEGVPVGFRLPGVDDEADAAWMRHLAPHAAFFTTTSLPEGDALASTARALGRLLFVGVPAGAAPPGPSRLGEAPGVLVLADDAGTDPTPGSAEEVVRSLRSGGFAGTVLVSGGVREPGDAVRLLDAGADLLALDDGLAASGSSLPRRIHESLAATAPASVRAGPWLGALLMGLALACIGLATGVSALTRVLLPYDEANLGAAARDLRAASGRLVPFLRHDRFSLAGTTVALGVLYVGLAWHAQRHGARWARTAVAASATSGFLGFLLFLAFDYLDPLHAVLALALLPPYLWSLGRTDGPGVRAVDLRDDPARRRALWGQLGLASVGFGLVVAGLAIAWVGSTTVLVDSDVAYLGADAERLRETNDRLLPLVAHDRATFGGTLVSNGVAIAVAAVMGVRRGAAWLWWTFLLAAVVGFGATLLVHARVGYTDPLHLAPVHAALALTVASLAGLRGYMLRPENAP